MKNFSQPPVGMVELAKAVSSVCSIIGITPIHSCDIVKLSELCKTVEIIESSIGIHRNGINGLLECGSRFQSVVNKLLAEGKLKSEQIMVL